MEKMQDADGKSMIIQSSGYFENLEVSQYNNEYRQPPKQNRTQKYLEYRQYAQYVTPTSMVAMDRLPTPISLSPSKLPMYCKHSTSQNSLLQLLPHLWDYLGLFSPNR